MAEPSESVVSDKFFYNKQRQIAFSFMFMQDPSTKYTVIKLIDPTHQEKLKKYLDEFQGESKTSFCRFYLRGLCIMKNQYCKFAHGFDQLNLDDQEYRKLSLIECAITEKQQRKRLFIQKTDFYQRPLFFIKQLDYYWLYQYQFSQRYKKSNIAPLTQEQVNKNEPVRNRIREVMHRQQWDKFITFIEKTFVNVDYTISMFSNWFARMGFEKAQTMSKFGDFMRYLTFVKGYTELNIVAPPLLCRCIYYVKKNATTRMNKYLEQLIEDSEMHRAKVRKMKQQRAKRIPEDLQKKFICRFYMAGNCEKSREECFYVHDIADIRYHRDQQFLTNYRQPPKSKEDRLNYVSLYRFYNQNKSPTDKEINMDDINSNFILKDSIRKRVHLRLYAAFLNKLQNEYKMDVLPVNFIRNQYQKFGFNHTDENKFGQLEAYFWDLGYYTYDEYNYQIQKKQQFITKIPQLETMDNYFNIKILSILKSQLDDSIKRGQNPQILESSIRRLIYNNNLKRQIPLHVYLRQKKVAFKTVLQSFSQYTPYIFFESGQQNFRKMIDFLKKYFKRYKRFVYTMQEIDSYVRGLKKEEFNLNSFVNYKFLLELALLQMGKQIYFWPFTSAILVIDRSHPTNPNKHQLHAQKQFITEPLHPEFIEKYQHFYNEKVIVVDSSETFAYCAQILQSCSQFGVDLQGRLTVGGYIDFIQISCINIKKLIFIIDIYKVKRDDLDLYSQINTFIRGLFEDESRLKIMHSCQQDIVALYSCMKINTKNVFDTSGMEIYYEQRHIYNEMRQKDITYEHTIKHIHNTKTPGLNQVLEKWGAPNGPNQYKERMKKVFNEESREYFERRPIVQQFLNYSARDVEDLIEVQQSMLKHDGQKMWKQIGKLYSNYRQQ